MSLTLEVQRKDRKNAMLRKEGFANLCAPCVQNVVFFLKLMTLA